MLSELDAWLIKRSMLRLSAFLAVIRCLAAVVLFLVFLGWEYIDVAKLDELIAKKLLRDVSRSNTFYCEGYLTAVDLGSTATITPSSITMSLVRLATFKDLRISVLVFANSGNCLYSYLRSLGILIERDGLVVPEGGR